MWQYQPCRALTVRLAVETCPTSNGSCSWWTIAAEKTVSDKGSWIAERGRGTVRHDFPDAEVN